MTNSIRDVEVFEQKYEYIPRAELKRRVDMVVREEGVAYIL